jgi:hypothetical protein
LNGQQADQKSLHGSMKDISQELNSIHL